MKTKLLVLVIGNIGTGKTSFIKTLNIRKHRRIITCDDYDEYKLFLHEIMKAKYSCTIKTIIIEGNYMSKSDRYTLLHYFMDARKVCFDFGPGNVQTLNNRLLFSVDNEERVQETHYKYFEEYDQPSKKEGFSKIIRCY